MNMLYLCFAVLVFVFFKQKTAYEMRISDWSSDVCSSDLGHQEAERLILETVDQRRVRMVSETFMVTALIAETNDLVLTVPRSVARVVRSPRMTVVTPPLDLPTIEVKQYWHERFDHDPGNMWLRSEEHTSELQSLMRNSYAVFCWQKK